jgi:hypothetical protein
LCLAAILLLLVTPSGTDGAIITSQFDVTQGTSDGPPYPTSPPIAIEVTNPPYVPLLLFVASKGSPDPSTFLRFQLVAVDIVDLPGPSATIDGLYLDPAPFPAEPHFEMSYELTSSLGHVVAIGHDFVEFDADQPQTFTSGVELQIEDAASQELGVQSLTINWQIGPGQPLSFANPGVAATMGDSFFDIFFDLNVSGLIDPDLPLFTATMTGQFQQVPEPATIWLLAAGVLGAAWIATQGSRSSRVATRKKLPQPRTESHTSKE